MARFTDMRLQQFLSESAGRLGAKTAMVAGNTRHSYADLERKSDRFAAELLGRGVSPGDRIVVFMDDCYEAVVTIFAVLKAGGVLLLIDPATEAEQLANACDDSRAIAVVTQARLASVAAAAIAKSSSVRLVALAGGHSGPASRTCLRFEDAVNGIGSPPAMASTAGEQDPALVIYPSANGMVEPVTISHQQIVAAVAAAGPSPASASNNVTLKVQRIWFARGLYRLMAAVKAGTTVVLERGIERAHDLTDVGAADFHPRLGDI